MAPMLDREALGRQVGSFSRSIALRTQANGPEFIFQQRATGVGEVQTRAFHRRRSTACPVSSYQRPLNRHTRLSQGDFEAVSDKGRNGKSTSSHISSD